MSVTNPPAIRPVHARAVVALLAALLLCLHVLPAAAAVPSGQTYPGGTWSPPGAAFGMDPVKNVHLEMDDGKLLVGDVWYPTDLSSGERVTDALPVVLVIGNPYGPALVIPDDFARPYVEAGYIFVMFDTRGLLRSQGKWDFFGQREQLDSLRVIEWAAEELEGSNGDIGLYGGSYLGLNQLMAVDGLAADNPVKAMVPTWAGSYIYRDPEIVSGGIPTGFLSVYAGLTATGYPVPPDYAASFPAEAAVAQSDHAANDYAAAVADMNAGGEHAYLDEFWLDREPQQSAPMLGASDIPVLLWSGWDDIFLNGAFALYAQLQNTRQGQDLWGPLWPDETVDGSVQLVVGNYGHGEMPERDTQLYEDLQIQFFDTHLKGIDTGMQETVTPLHLFDTGTGQWVNFSGYPMTDQYTPFYLDADGAFAATAPSAAGSQIINWGGNDGSPTTATFTTAPFEDGAVLAGPIAARLWLTTTVTETMLVAKVEDIAPDGTATPVRSDDALIGGLRDVDVAKTWTDAAGRVVKPYHPYTKASETEVPVGEPVEQLIEVQARLRTLQPGHALRISISTAGEELTPTQAQQERLNGGVYELLYGGEHASYINVPLAAFGAFDAAVNADGPAGDWSSTAVAPDGVEVPDGAPIGAPGDERPGDDLVATGGGATPLALLVLALAFASSTRRRGAAFA